MDSAVETPETVDVVMPAYNEEEAIELAVMEVLESIVLKLPGSRLIVVDDGSTDSTRDILYALSEKHNEIKVISQTNAGHGPALVTGMALSSAPWIFLIDSDRQQDAADFWNLWNVRDENDLVMGVRQGRDDGKGRAVISAGLRQLGLILFGARLSDPNVPFKLVSRRLWVVAGPIIGPCCLIPSAALALIASRRNFAIAEVPISHRDRQGGKTTLIGWRLIRLCLRAAHQLLRLRRVA